jgi:hypothetical protein
MLCKQRSRNKQDADCGLYLHCCLLSKSSTGKTEALRSKNKFVKFHQTTLCHVPENRTVRSHCCENQMFPPLTTHRTNTTQAKIQTCIREVLSSNMSLFKLWPFPSKCFTNDVILPTEDIYPILVTESVVEWLTRKQCTYLECKPISWV